MALLLLSYALFVIARIPADFAWHHANVNRSQVQLFDISGTIYKGQSGTLITPQMRVTNVHWDWAPSALVGGKLAYAVTAETANGNLSGITKVPLSQLISGRVTRGIGEEIRASIPLSDLPLPPIARTIPLSAELLVNLNRLAVEYNLPSFIEGSVALSNINFDDGKQQHNLGILIADISTDDEGVITAELSSDSNQLELVGQATVQPDGRWEIAATLTISPELPRILIPILASSGRRQPDGSYKIAYNGALPNTRPIEE